MAKVTMKLEGFEQLQKALTTAPEAVRVRASSAVAASTFAVAQRARSIVPSVTGTLRNAITTTKTLTGLTGGVGLSTSEVYYWRFVEFGTRHMSARPFFRPAAEHETTHFIARMRAIGPALERDLSSGRTL